MKNHSRWLITLAACLTLLAVLAGFKYLQVKAAIAYGKSFPESSETVRAVTVEESLFKTWVSTIGEVVAPQAIELRNEAEGIIDKVNFTSGQQVKQGDILLQLDISEEQARLKAALARVNLAQLDLTRIKKLRQKNTVSQEQLDQAQAEYNILQADVQALQATIDKKTLRAPFDAVVGLHNFEVGEYLGSNSFIVNLLGINDYLWVDFNLPMSNAATEIGSEVKIQVSATETEQKIGQIIAKDPTASASSRNLRFRAKIDSQLSIPPNSVVKVLVPTGQSTEIVVPVTALLKDGMGDYVYVLSADESGKGYRAKRRSVVIGNQNDKLASIYKGLKTGELVATEGAFKLRENVLTYVAGNDSGKDSGSVFSKSGNDSTAGKIDGAGDS